jgi:hypothetical protein
MPGTKGQHYITESYQLNFSDVKGKIWVLDKNDKIFSTNPINTFKEAHFYTITFPSFPKPLLVERTLAGIEGDFATVVKEKLEKGISLTNDDRVSISLFVSAMFIRTKTQRDNIKNFLTNTLRKIRSIKSDPKLVEFYKSIPSSSLDKKDSFLSEMELEKGLEDFDSFHSLTTMDNMYKIAPIIFEMKWIFLVAPENKVFISSDNPLNTVSPEREKKYGANSIGSRAGLAHADVELTFPISSKITLFGSWKNKEECYITATEKQVDELNYRIIRRTKNLFSNNKEIFEHILQVEKDNKKYQSEKNLYTLKNI